MSEEIDVISNAQQNLNINISEVNKEIETVKEKQEIHSEAVEALKRWNETTQQINDTLADLINTLYMKDK